MPVVLAVAAAAALALLLIRSRDAAARARSMRRTGLVFMAVATALIGMFIIGETLSAPGGWLAAALITLWLAPLAGLSALARLRPRWAAPVLSALTAAVIAAAIWFAVDPAEARALEMGHGPVRAVATFILCLPIALLGWRRPLAGGILLTVLGAAPLAALAAGGGPGDSSLAAVSVLPLVTGVLYLIGEAFARRASAGNGAKRPADRRGRWRRHLTRRSHRPHATAHR